MFALTKEKSFYSGENISISLGKGNETCVPTVKQIGCASTHTHKRLGSVLDCPCFYLKY